MNKFGTREEICVSGSVFVHAGIKQNAFSSFLNRGARLTDKGLMRGSFASVPDESNRVQRYSTESTWKQRFLQIEFDTEGFSLTLFRPKEDRSATPLLSDSRASSPFSSSVRGGGGPSTSAYFSAPSSPTSSPTKKGGRKGSPAGKKGGKKAASTSEEVTPDSPLGNDGAGLGIGSTSFSSIRRGAGGGGPSSSSFNHSKSRGGADSFSSQLRKMTSELDLGDPEHDHMVENRLFREQIKQNKAVEKTRFLLPEGAPIGLKKLYLRSKPISSSNANANNGEGGGSARIDESNNTEFFLLRQRNSFTGEYKTTDHLFVIQLFLQGGFLEFVGRTDDNTHLWFQRLRSILSIHNAYSRVKKMLLSKNELPVLPGRDEFPIARLVKIEEGGGGRSASGNAMLNNNSILYNGNHHDPTTMTGGGVGSAAVNQSQRQRFVLQMVLCKLNLFHSNKGFDLTIVGRPASGQLLYWRLCLDEIPVVHDTDQYATIFAAPLTQVDFENISLGTEPKDELFLCRKEVEMLRILRGGEASERVGKGTGGLFYLNKWANFLSTFARLHAAAHPTALQRWGGDDDDDGKGSGGDNKGWISDVNGAERALKALQNGKNNTNATNSGSEGGGIAATRKKPTESTVDYLMREEARLNAHMRAEEEKRAAAAADAAENEREPKGAVDKATARGGASDGGVGPNAKASSGGSPQQQQHHSHSHDGRDGARRRSSAVMAGGGGGGGDSDFGPMENSTFHFEGSNAANRRSDRRRSRRRRSDRRSNSNSRTTNSSSFLEDEDRRYTYSTTSSTQSDGESSRNGSANSPDPYGRRRRRGGGSSVNSSNTHNEEEGWQRHRRRSRSSDRRRRGGHGNNDNSYPHGNGSGSRDRFDNTAPPTPHDGLSRSESRREEGDGEGEDGSPLHHNHYQDRALPPTTLSSSPPNDHHHKPPRNADPPSPPMLQRVRSRRIVHNGSLIGSVDGDSNRSNSSNALRGRGAVAAARGRGGHNHVVGGADGEGVYDDDDDGGWGGLDRDSTNSRSTSNNTTYNHHHHHHHHHHNNNTNSRNGTPSGGGGKTIVIPSVQGAASVPGLDSLSANFVRRINSFKALKEVSSEVVGLRESDAIMQAAEGLSQRERAHQQYTEGAVMHLSQKEGLAAREAVEKAKQDALAVQFSGGNYTTTNNDSSGRGHHGTSRDRSPRRGGGDDYRDRSGGRGASGGGRTSSPRDERQRYEIAHRQRDGSVSVSYSTAYAKFDKNSPDPAERLAARLHERGISNISVTAEHTSARGGGGRAPRDKEAMLRDPTPRSHYQRDERALIESIPLLFVDQRHEDAMFAMMAFWQKYPPMVPPME